MMISRLNEKRVIFVGGTDFSGSTMLDLMLGSTDYGLSTGEIYALFWPTKKHHLEVSCSCGKAICDFWNNVSLDRPDRVYQTLFEKLPQIRYLIDSSKYIGWIVRQSENLKSQNIAVNHVLIWKHPEDYAKSCLKRKRIRNWRKRWIRYHLAYFHRIHSPYVICLDDLLYDTDHEMRRMCDALGIEYDDLMLTYWKKEHHLLFGSKKAIHALRSKAGNEVSRKFDALEKSERKGYSIKLDRVKKREERMVSKILSTLSSNGKERREGNWVNGQYLFYLQKLKFTMRRIYFNILTRVFLDKSQK
jgi:hypothetical protein